MEKRKILFVCLGNICRSPAAEAVMQKLIESQGLTENFELDSAGILDYHKGEQADHRMRSHALRRGYNITHISRQIKINDFLYFDLILGMDASNIEKINQLASNVKHNAEIKLLTDFSQELNYDHVPDPYYGGPDGFELVLDIAEDSCKGVLKAYTRNEE